MSTIKEITEKYEKVYIKFNNTAARRKFVSDALKEGVVFTDGSIPELSATDDIIALYSDKTIARLGWAGRVVFHNNKDNVPVIEY